MATFILIVIYISFISLGLPDSMLGAAWPAMRQTLGLSLDAAGIVTMVVTGGTVVSSLLSDKITTRFGAGRVTAVSVLATAAALLGFSVSPSLAWLIVCSVPLGLGGGAVDAALNNYVALHYAPHHMSWLHCFWGLGAFLGPTVIAGYLRSGGAWRSGYLTIGILQVAVALLVFIAQPTWLKLDKKNALAAKQAPETQAAAPSGRKGVLGIPGVPFALLTFFLYCSLEYCANLWSSSFFVEARGLGEAMAAQGTSLFFVGITAGRLLTGFLTFKLSSKALIRWGCLSILLGALLMALPLPGMVSVAGLTLVGLGCAPVYPCMIHETPANFGAANSQKIIGFQMASAYTGSMLMPPLFGFIAERTGISILPGVMLAIGLGLLLCSEMVGRLTIKQREKA